ncbi:MAG: NADPH-dependent FMN reductase [Parcubacteria group bacterium Gr01-1014_107]|nr:MAG: NADPH-dependent FMN reductase [Parcubacteria group bacterium Gr01-1014_107]
MTNNMKKSFIAIIGSLRKGSYNRMLYEAAKKLLPEKIDFKEIPIKNLPLYNQDLEENFPKEARELKDSVKKADGIIFFTPEFNRTIPAPLKNAIDWISRPYGKNSIAGKPVYVMGATVGGVGTALSQYNLKQALLYLDANILGQPEFYLSMAGQKFNTNGELTDELTKNHLKQAMERFVSYTDQFSLIK